MTLSPCSIPGPALPIISPGPVDIPACAANAFSLQI
jgi:hypothetical protein